MKKVLTMIAAIAMVMPLAAQTTASFYSLSATTHAGEKFSFDQLKGKYVLIVNTASKCGYTPQYAGLQNLYLKYNDRLTVIAFPSNQFGRQEPGDNTEIYRFCTDSYSVTFPVMEKSDVIGDEQNSVYRWLTSKSGNGWNTDKPVWNFCKYLVNDKGELVRYFTSKVAPMDDEITSLLK
jgi:glutathione peroxidase